MAPIEAARTTLFKRLIAAVWGILIFYSVFFYVLGSELVFYSVLSGAVLFSPLTLWLENRGKQVAARVFFCICCNYYIYVSSLGLSHSASSEYYFLPASMLPMLIFNDSQRRWVWGSIAWTFLFWVLMVTLGTDFVPSSWLTVDAPFALIRKVNFVGAFGITLVILTIFLKTNLDLKDLLVEQAHQGARSLKEFASRLEESQRIAKVGSWHYDIAQGHLTWSPENYRIFEIDGPRSASELFGLYRSRIHPDDLPELDRHLERALSQGEDYVFNHRVYLDGGRRIKSVQGIAKVTRGPDGKPVALSGTCQDLTDLIRLQEQNQFILSSMGIGIWRYSGEAQRLFWDKTVHALYEIPEQEFTGSFEQWLSLLTPGSRELIERDNTRVMNGDRSFDTTLEIVTRTGKHKFVGSRGKVITDEQGRPIEFYGISWDKTAEVLLEQSLQEERAKALHTSKLASLGEMSAGIAHEINNPLAIISASLSQLKRVVEDPAKLDVKIEQLSKAAKRIEKIVSGLRRFSRTSGSQIRKTESFHAIVSEALVMAETKAKRHNVAVAVQVPETLQIYCDGMEIEQVIINLVNNAVDAVKTLPERWVRIEAMEDQGFRIVRVIDSGAGIPPAIEPKLFQPFFTTKPVGEGTGLGLSIIRGILEQHQATIRLDRSHPNTCFEIRFPDPTGISAKTA